MFSVKKKWPFQLNTILLRVKSIRNIPVGNEITMHNQCWLKDGRGLTLLDLAACFHSAPILGQSALMTDTNINNPVLRKKKVQCGREDKA